MKYMDNDNLDLTDEEKESAQNHQRSMDFLVSLIKEGEEENPRLAAWLRRKPFYWQIED